MQHKWATLSVAVVYVDEAEGYRTSQYGVVQRNTVQYSFVRFGPPLRSSPSFTDMTKYWITPLKSVTPSPRQLYKKLLIARGGHQHHTSVFQANASQQGHLFLYPALLLNLPTTRVGHPGFAFVLERRIFRCNILPNQD